MRKKLADWLRALANKIDGGGGPKPER